MTSSVQARDELNDAANLVEAAYMACESLLPHERSPLCTLLDLVRIKLRAAQEGLSAGDNESSQAGCYATTSRS